MKCCICIVHDVICNSLKPSPNIIGIEKISHKSTTYGIAAEHGLSKHVVLIPRMENTYWNIHIQLRLKVGVLFQRSMEVEFAFLDKRNIGFL